MATQVPQVLSHRPSAISTTPRMPCWTSMSVRPVRGVRCSRICAERPSTRANSGEARSLMLPITKDADPLISGRSRFAWAMSIASIATPRSTSGTTSRSALGIHRLIGHGPIPPCG